MTALVDANAVPLSPEVQAEAGALLDDYERACDMLRSTYGDRGIEMAEAYTDECYDRLSRFVVQHDLEGTEFDPDLTDGSAS